MIAVYGRMGYAGITSTFAYSAAYAVAAQPFWRTRVPARPRTKLIPSGVRMAGCSRAGSVIPLALLSRSPPGAPDAPPSLLARSSLVSPVGAAPFGSRAVSSLMASHRARSDFAARWHNYSWRATPVVRMN